MSTVPKCDGCGKFTQKGTEVGTTKPDFWNGPDVTLYCPRCLAVAFSAWNIGFQVGRRADHNSMWWPGNPFKAESAKTGGER